jgi:hypothetical protein
VDVLLSWSARRWLAAAAATLIVFVAVGVPTDVIANPWFGRPVVVTWWSYPVLVVTAVLGGLLVATYVRDDAGAELGDELDDRDQPGRAGGIGGLLSFFAVGCPTCNKLAVVAVGTTGAIDWFAPMQPLLAIGSIGLLAWAFRARLRSARNCRIVR